MRSDRLCVALWGIGRHARRRLLPAIAETAGLELVGVHTRNGGTGAAAAAEAGCRFYRDTDEMLADNGVKAVILSTPTGLHHAQGLKVLGAGKHLIAEKPLTHSLATTCDLLAAAERADRLAVSALMYKYHAQFRQIRAVVDEGLVGEVRAISVNFGLPPLGTGTFRDDPALGGGALLDMACYGLSLAYQLLPAPPVLVASRIASRGGSPVDTEGWCVLADGDVSVHCQWGMGRAYQNRAEIWGSRGRLLCERVFTKEADHVAELLLIDERSAEARRWQIPAENAYRRMFEEIALCIGDPDFFASERGEAEWCAAIVQKMQDREQRG